jgi:hypothetical protein
MFARLTRAVTVFSLVTTSALAQEARAPQFQTDAFYAGPRVWLGNLHGAIAVGGQIERGFTKAGAYGPGVIAGGIGVDYYSWSFDYPVGSYSYSVIPIQVFANYHFVIEKNPKFDPYLGMALVYSAVSASWEGAGVAASADGSGTTFAGQAGLRYFMSEKFALQGQLGFGYGTLGVGATWRF